MLTPHFPLDRRTLLLAGGAALCGAAGELRRAQAEAAPVRARPARSVIMIWLSGGASHIDTWDMKPDAPLEYRGLFQPVATSAPGVELCEHLPFLAQQAHHLAVVRSLGDFGRGTGDHHAGYYYNLTGRAPDPSFHRLLNARTPYADDWPAMASVVAYKRAPHPYLPQNITLPHLEGAPEYTRPGQFAAKLGVEYDPLIVEAKREQPLDYVVPALQLQGDVSYERLVARQELLSAVDDAQVRLQEQLASGVLSRVNYSKHQHKAFSLLASRESRAAFDLSAEPDSVLERYGRGINSTTLLMARRLVEAGVPWVTVFWKGDDVVGELCKSGGGWDTHGNNFNCLKDHLLPEFDRPYSALLADLHERGLLEETLVIVSSEMGRKPKIGDPRSGGVNGAGRDHWTRAMSVLLAGGGIRGGQVYGSSDPRAEAPADKPVAPEDIAQTLFYALGLSDLEMTSGDGRPVQLMPEGRVLGELF